jgi:hypothetical protein
MNIEVDSTPEIIEELPVENEEHRWEPVVRRETAELLDHLMLPAKNRELLLTESVEVLARCLPPSDPDGEETGLVVGYVQSGKTMSFTTVTALARDNGYALVLLIAGSSTPLLGQSTRRLRSDLRIETRKDRAWLPVASDTILKASSRDGIKGVLADWRDTTIKPDERPTVLITTMKNHTHLKKVIRALSAIDLHGLPALVIDDEADQASLNTLVLKSDESTTYRQIRDLRKTLPHHTYLQYTATPQAPLLINIIDTLSPGFAQVLTPGDAYVGGLHFFSEHPELIEPIPEGELPSAVSEDVPDSLVKALRLFLVGVAAGMIVDQSTGNRSMMIHPSQRTQGHSEYLRWVKQVWSTWQMLLAQPDDSEDRAGLLDDFREAYDSLAATVSDIPPFEEIVGRLSRAVRKTVIEEINAVGGRTPHIDWRSHYSWILVGGQAMDRGFTVEGLTVTYMPRGLGVGNADTVQQRARFFGYKQTYLGYCRVFLEQATADAYKSYVEHEEDVRNGLLEHATTGAPLTDWKRKFMLDPSLQPTRAAVLDVPFARSSGESQWVWTRMPHDSTEAILANRGTVERFLGLLSLSYDPGSERRTEHEIHRWDPDVPLRTAMEELLTRVKLSNPNDSSAFTLLQILLGDHLAAHPDERCVVFEMSSGKTRDRSLNAKGEITNLFQGAAPSKPREGLKVGDIYPGDRELATTLGIPVIQIHHVNVKGPDKQVISEDVIAIAVYVPSTIARDLLVQDQP